MASDFRTTQEQKLWDQLSKELDDVEKLTSPKAITKAIGTIGLVSSRVPMSAENERSLKSILSKLRTTLNRGDVDKAKTAQEQRELTASVRTFISHARSSSEQEKIDAAQVAVKAYREALKEPAKRIQSELVALRASSSNAEKETATYRKREKHLLDAMSDIRDLIDDVNAGIRAETAGITNVVELEKRIGKSIAALNHRLSSTISVEIDTAIIPKPAVMDTILNRVDQVVKTNGKVRAAQTDIAAHVAMVSAQLEAVRNGQDRAESEREIDRLTRGKTTTTDTTRQAVPNVLRPDEHHVSDEESTAPLRPAVAPINVPSRTQMSPLAETIESLREQMELNDANLTETIEEQGNRISRIVAPHHGAVGLSVAPAIFSPDANNLNEYEQEKVDSDRRTFLSLFNRLVDNVADMTRGGRASGGLLGSAGASAGGVLKNLFALLGLGGLLGMGKGKPGNVKLKIASGVKDVAQKIGGRFAGLFAAASGVASRTLGPGIMTAVKTVLKRGVFAVPVVGTLIGAILMGTDTETLTAVTDWLGPTFENLKMSVGEGIGMIGRYLETNGVQSIAQAFGEYAPVATEAMRSVMQGIDDVVIKPFNALRAGIATYAEKWKDIPVLSNMMGSLDQLFNRPGEAAAELFEKMQGSGMQNMDSLNLLLREISQGKSFTELTASKEAWQGIQDTRATLTNVDKYIQDRTDSAIASVKDTVSTTYGNVTSGAQSMWGRVKQRASDTTQAYIDDAKGLASSVYDTLGQAAGALYSLRGGVDVTNLDPSFSNSILGALNEYHQVGGKHRVTLTSGFRSAEDQERLFAESPGKAAPPGRSLHQYGLALDADRNALGDMDRMGILAKFGLERPFASEPWHVQPIGLTDPAAKAGIFSADFSTSQGKSIMFGSTDTGGAARPSYSPVPAVGVSNMRNAPSPVTEKQASGGSNKSNNSSSTSKAVSVEQMPKYTVNDKGFLATNLGVLAP